jgi:hypothetical protein
MLKNVLKTKIVQPFLFLLLGFLFVVLGNLGIFNGLRSGISYIFEPFSSTAMQWQESVSSWASLLSDASSYIEENRNLKKEILEMKANERIPYWVTEVIGHRNYRLIRISKYCTGLEAAQKVPNYAYEVY